MTEQKPPSGSESAELMTTLSRRNFMKYTAAAGATALGGGLLDAPADQEAPPRRPRPEALASQSVAEPFESASPAAVPMTPWTPISRSRSRRSPDWRMLYDTVLRFDDDMVMHPSLATEVTSNSDATVWAICLRDGVTFHNGKDLTADDLAYTFHRIIKGKPPSLEANLLPIDVTGMKKLDRLPFRFPRPNRGR